MQKPWTKILTVLCGLIFIITAVGGLVSGCKKAEEKKETKKGQKEETIEKKEAKFENPNLLVTTDWLIDNLSNEHIQIIDVRAEGDFSGGHIEGAVNLPIPKTVDADNPIPGMAEPEEQMGTLLGDLGISSDSHLIVYDAGGTPYAGRIYWILKYYGHEEVSVLDGGIKQWQKEGKKIKFDEPEITKTTYTATANPDINATKNQTQEWIEEEDEDVVLVDARPKKEWDEGHFPDAVRLDWVELLTDDDPPLLKSAGELQELFDNAGITEDKELVLY